MRNLRYLKKKDFLVELIQVKGHSGVHGNEETDRLTYGLNKSGINTMKRR